MEDFTNWGKDLHKIDLWESHYVYPNYRTSECVLSGFLQAAIEFIRYLSYFNRDQGELLQLLLVLYTFLASCIAFTDMKHIKQCAGQNPLQSCQECHCAKREVYYCMYKIEQHPGLDNEGYGFTELFLEWVYYAWMVWYEIMLIVQDIAYAGIMKDVAGLRFSSVLAKLQYKFSFASHDYFQPNFLSQIASLDVGAGVGLILFM